MAPDSGDPAIDELDLHVSCNSYPFRIVRAFGTEWQNLHPDAARLPRHARLWIGSHEFVVRRERSLVAHARNRYPDRCVSRLQFIHEDLRIGKYSLHVVESLNPVEAPSLLADCLHDSVEAAYADIKEPERSPDEFHDREWEKTLAFAELRSELFEKGYSLAEVDEIIRIRRANAG